MLLFLSVLWYHASKQLPRVVPQKKRKKFVRKRGRTAGSVLRRTLVDSYYYKTLSRHYITNLEVNKYLWDFYKDPGMLLTPNYYAVKTIILLLLPKLLPT